MAAEWWFIKQCYYKKTDSGYQNEVTRCLVPLRIRSFGYKMALKPFKPATMRFFFWKNSTNSGITTNTPPEPQNHECQGKCIPTYSMIRGVASNESSLQCRHTWT
jgi:hypothetical protein